jgi:hypothetical protein
MKISSDHFNNLFEIISWCLGALRHTLDLTLKEKENTKLN